MISSWNDLICRNNVLNRMNMKLYTGGGYRNNKGHSSISHALIITDNIRGYVYPVINDVFFRQHRYMLSFLRACIGTMRYTAVGDSGGYR